MTTFPQSGNHVSRRETAFRSLSLWDKRGNCVTQFGRAKRGDDSGEARTGTAVGSKRVLLGYILCLVCRFCVTERRSFRAECRFCFSRLLAIVVSEHAVADAATFEPDYLSEF